MAYQGLYLGYLSKYTYNISLTLSTPKKNNNTPITISNSFIWPLKTINLRYIMFYNNLKEMQVPKN